MRKINDEYFLERITILEDKIDNLSKYLDYIVSEINKINIMENDDIDIKILEQYIRKRKLNKIDGTK